VRASCAPTIAGETVPQLVCAALHDLFVEIRAELLNDLNAPLPRLLLAAGHCMTACCRGELAPAAAAAAGWLQAHHYN
jgi:hypothetical protein